MTTTTTKFMAGAIAKALSSENRQGLMYVTVGDITNHQTIVPYLGIDKSALPTGFSVQVSGEDSGSEGELAFDKTITKKWEVSGVKEADITITLDKPAIIIGYGLNGAATGTNSPRTWNVLGFNSNTDTWDLLYIQSKPFTSWPDTSDMYKFNIPNTTQSYSRLKLDITSSNGTGVGVTEFQVYEYDKDSSSTKLLSPLETVLSTSVEENFSNAITYKFDYTNDSGVIQKIREIAITERIESPFMNSNSLPFGIASTHSGGTQDYEFMDGDLSTTKTLSAQNNFLKYEFPQGTIVNHLEVKGTNSWYGVVLQASNDNSTWEELYDLSSHDGDVDAWFHNNNPYLYYRLFVPTLASYSPIAKEVRFFSDIVVSKMLVYKKLLNTETWSSQLSLNINTY